MTPPRYQYTPLSSDNSFRLFKPKKAAKFFNPSSSTIEIELFEASLQNPPPFEAVSYAWGNECATSTILCNGALLYVSPTVHDILHALDGLESLWIDSICIDQTSTAEKNLQVPRMRTIYVDAEQVWVWLGKGTYETQKAFELLLDIDKEMLWDGTEDQVQFQRMMKRQAQFSDEVRAHRGVYDAADTDFIVDILNLPYWHRTWTVQELLLAKYATLICGPTCMPWRSYFRALQLVQILANKNRQSEAQIGITSNPATFYDDIQDYVAFNRFIRNLSIAHTPISSTLSLVRRRLATDPRDKVYGLYGIFEHWKISCLPKVDYKSTVQCVYSQITLAALEFEKSLDILYRVCLQPLIRDLPSWVPDWSNTAYHQPLYPRRFDEFDDFDPHGPFYASGSSQALYVVDGHRLSVSAVLVDAIGEASVSTSWCTANFRRGYTARADLSSNAERHSAVVELIRTLQSWIMLSRRLKTYPTGEDPVDAFYETLLHDNVGKVRYDTDERSRINAFRLWKSILTAETVRNRVNLGAWLEDIQGVRGYASTVADYVHQLGCTENPSEWADELKIRLVLRVLDAQVSVFQHNVALLSYHKTYFTTRDGYMGVGPRWVSPGDSVALIAGLGHPFIVRKTGEDFVLIGPAYIRGIMVGERWDEEKAGTITLV